MRTTANQAYLGPDECTPLTPYMGHGGPSIAYVRRCERATGTVDFTGCSFLVIVIEFFAGEPEPPAGILQEVPAPPKPNSLC